VRGGAATSGGGAVARRSVRHVCPLIGSRHGLGDTLAASTTAAAGRSVDEMAAGRSVDPDELARAGLGG